MQLSYKLRYKVGMYRIRNIINGKKYIGSSENIKNRFRQHRCALNKGNHCNQKLQAAYNKHGSENFVFEVMFICEKRDLLSYEQKCLDLLKPEYNLAKDAARPGLGRIVSEELKQKYSKLYTGQKHTPEAVEKIRLASVGRKQSDAAKEKIRLAKLGKKRDQETIDKIKATRVKEPLVAVDPLTLKEVFRIEGVREAEKRGYYSSVIYMCMDINSRRKTYKGYIWCYASDYDSGAYLEFAKAVVECSRVKTRVHPIEALDKVTREVKFSFKNVNDAAKSGFNKTYIMRCLAGRQAACNGLIWRYVVNS